MFKVEHWFVSRGIWPNCGTGLNHQLYWCLNSWWPMWLGLPISFNHIYKIDSTIATLIEEKKVLFISTVFHQEWSGIGKRVSGPLERKFTKQLNEGFKTRKFSLTKAFYCSILKCNQVINMCKGYFLQCYFVFLNRQNSIIIAQSSPIDKKKKLLLLNSQFYLRC